MKREREEAARAIALEAMRAAFGDRADRWPSVMQARVEDAATAQIRAQQLAFGRRVLLVERAGHVGVDQAHLRTSDYGILERLADEEGVTQSQLDAEYARTHCPDCGVAQLEFHREGCPQLPPTGLQVIR